MVDRAFMPMKVCGECGHSKFISPDNNLSGFSPHATAKGGYHPKCKECRSAYTRSKYKKK